MSVASAPSRKLNGSLKSVAYIWGRVWEILRIINTLLPKPQIHCLFHSVPFGIYKSNLSRISNAWEGVGFGTGPFVDQPKWTFIKFAVKTVNRNLNNIFQLAGELWFHMATKMLKIIASSPQWKDIPYVQIRTCMATYMYGYGYESIWKYANAYGTWNVIIGHSCHGMWIS